jgi:hypothetical protein
VPHSFAPHASAHTHCPFVQDAYVEQVPQLDPHPSLPHSFPEHWGEQTQAWVS